MEGNLVFTTSFNCTVLYLGHSVHNSQEMLTPPSILILFQFYLVYLEELVPAHRTASRISEILIRNQLALIRDELLCH